MTDDVDTTPVGAAEISAGVDFEQNAKFPLSGLRGDLTRVGDVRVKVGFASNIEFQVEGVLQNFLAINSSFAVSAVPLSFGGNSSNDTGDFTLSTKIKLRNETRSLPALGFKFGFELPNSDQSRGIGTIKSMFSVKFWCRKNSADTPEKLRASMFSAISDLPF